MKALARQLLLPARRVAAMVEAIALERDGDVGDISDCALAPGLPESTSAWIEREVEIDVGADEHRECEKEYADHDRATKQPPRSRGEAGGRG
jgi:hypothetical protein